MKKYYIPPNAPPPLTVTPRSIQKDSIEIKPTTKKLTFDDLETREKPPIKTRQGDSITTSVNKPVNKVVNTAVVYIPLSHDVPHRAIAPLPSDSLQVLHPGAVLVDCVEELKKGMNVVKPISKSIDLNQVLECHPYHR